MTTLAAPSFDTTLASVQAQLAALDPNTLGASPMEPVAFEAYCTEQTAKADAEAKAGKPVEAQKRLAHLQKNIALAKHFYGEGELPSVSVFKDPWQATPTDATVKPQDAAGGNGSPFANEKDLYKAFSMFAEAATTLGKISKGADGKVSVQKAFVVDLVKATGAAAQRMSEVFGMLAVTPQPNDPFYKVADSVESALRSLYQAAQVELILGGGAPAAGAAPAAPPPTAEKSAAEKDANGVPPVVAPPVVAPAVFVAPAVVAPAVVAPAPGTPPTAPAEGTPAPGTGAAAFTPEYVDTLPDSAFLHVSAGGSQDAEGKTVPRENRMFAVRDAGGAVIPERITTVIGLIAASGLSPDEKARLTTEAQALVSKSGGTDDDGWPSDISPSATIKQAPTPVVKSAVWGTDPWLTPRK